MIYMFFNMLLDEIISMYFSMLLDEMYDIYVFQYPPG